MARKKHLINVHTSTGTTAPTGASLYLGEIAVQHTPSNPAIWIKMGTSESSNQYEKFIGSTEVKNYVDGNISAITEALDNYVCGITMNNTTKRPTNGIVNLGTVITAETQLSTATTGTGNVVGSIGVSNHKITTTMFSAASADQLSKLSGGTISLVASSAASVYSSAVSYVNSAITGLDSSTAVTAGKYITGIAIADGKISGITEANLPSAPAITASTAGTGNVFTAVSSTGHSMTFTKGMTAAAKDDLDGLSAATTAHTANTTAHITSTERTRWNNAWTSGVSAYTKVEALSAGTIALVGASAASVFSSAQTYTNNEIGKLDSTGVTSDSGHYLTSVTITNGKISAVGEVAVPAESDITTSSTGNGNVITNITATGHALTLAKGITAATSGQVSALSSATVAHINSAASHVSATDRTTWNGKQDAISDLATIRNNALSGASAYTRVNSLSAATTAHTANTTVHVTAADKAKWNAAVTGVTSAGTGNAFTEYSIADNILTLTKGATYLTTAATTTQGTRADNALQIVSGSTYINMSAKSGNAGAKMQTATVKQQGVETASATGQGLADAYDVKQYVEGLVTSSVDYKGATATLPTTSTVGDLYITTAQIALTAAQSATGAAQTAETGDFIIARSSGKWDVVQKNLDGAVTGSLTADTVTLGAGEHTVKSLANGSNGQVLSISSNKPAWVNASLTDTATTETGHYTPSTSASTKGTTAATVNFIKGVRLDSKNHVIDVVTGSVVTAETSVSVTNNAATNTATAVVSSVASGGTKGHALTISKTNKIFSAGTADSAATLTGNITTGQVTDLTTKIQTTKVNSAATADSATNAAVATKVKSALTVNMLNATGGTTSTITFDGSASKTVNIPANTDEHVTAVGNHYTATTATKTGGTTTATAASAVKGITYDGAGHIVGVTTGSVLTSFTETQLSTASTGTGNVVGSLTVSNHQITSNMFSAASAEQIVALSGATTTHTANTTVHVTANDKTKWNSAITSVTQNGTSVVTNNVAKIEETSVSTTNGTASNTATAAITGITTGGTKGHALTLAKTNKIFSASTSDSAITVVSAVTSWSAQTAILGPSYTYSGLPYVTSATSIADAYSALTKEVIESEIVAATALNDLNGRVLATSGAYVELVDEINDSEKVIAASLNDLNDRIIEISGNVADFHVDMILGSGYTYSGLPYVNSATTIADAYSALTKVLRKDEKVISAALNGLNDRILAMSGDINTINEKIDDFHIDMILGSGYTYSGLPYVNSATTMADAYSAITKVVIDDELVTAGGLNDLNDRVMELSGSVAELSDNINTKRKTTIGPDGFEPNVVYNLGTLMGTYSFVLAPAESEDIVNHYYWTFETSTNPPSVTWPSGITKWAGNCVQNGSPVLVANAHYEVSIMDGYAFIVGV